MPHETGSIWRSHNDVMLPDSIEFEDEDHNCLKKEESKQGRFTSLKLYQLLKSPRLLKRSRGRKIFFNLTVLQGIVVAHGKLKLI